LERRKGRFDLRLSLVLGHVGGRRHLPIVELIRLTEQVRAFHRAGSQAVEVCAE